MTEENSKYSKLIHKGHLKEQQQQGQDRDSVELEFEDGGIKSLALLCSLLVLNRLLLITHCF